MAEGRRERADAVRNRQAILRATEELLTRHGPEEISMERIAAAAGVGKGTLFHRFGSRMGLMRALMEERALTLGEAVAAGPPPLGPGAPPSERLLAFLDGLVDLVARNKGLLAALGHAATTAHKDDKPHPLHARWHDHIRALIAEARPDLDADLLAHILIGSVQGNAVRRLLEQGGEARVARSLHTLVTALLAAAPQAPAPGGADSGAGARPARA
ncbi:MULTISPECIES: TetR/AcrR family transcriptional regulator [Thermomonosporaceae]|uniref:TetR/AcrR family transcriptional regulator n=1 Tax=Thermomonosporaceae TaxID=2012 RepID=UPI00255B23EA|nr:MULTISPECIES: TetR/AcrR family transcriptional regulator [Thermomonosporaceae]MDL4771239.1 helix-turn-helix domain-containing protein [Actinomadura xylanilytica]